MAMLEVLPGVYMHFGVLNGNMLTERSRHLGRRRRPYFSANGSVEEPAFGGEGCGGCVIPGISARLAEYEGGNSITCPSPSSSSMMSRGDLV
jgi:hypothetical protein